MLKTLIKKEISSMLESQVMFNHRMAKYTSFHIGGLADAIVFPRNINEIIKITMAAINLDIPLTILGGGSNTLIKDQGIRGIVMIISNWDVNLQLIKKLGKHRIFKVASGVSIKNICTFSIKNALSDINFALGIPGTIGGALTMNAGTSKNSMSDILHSITILNKNTGRVKKFTKPNLKFLYRKWPQKKNNIILECEISLVKGNHKEIIDKAKNFIITKANNQPLFASSAGCFFKNPKINLSAGELIDKAGLKGKRIGGAIISKKHANFIINKNRATAYDVLKLANLARNLVYKFFQVSLEPEVNIIGD